MFSFFFPFAYFLSLFCVVLNIKVNSYSLVAGKDGCLWPGAGHIENQILIFSVSLVQQKRVEP